mgnify:CR=1 FL=1|tara:strand:- start:48 stop:731 length:684 start_codon:yes stop_codon:yes gene_type:complete
MRADDFTRQHFTWFTGIVEDITDPEKLNRCKVRCIGYHDDNKDLLPKEKLPWATVIMPVTSAAYQGIGGNHHLEVGSWVVGFFRDGPSAQDPIIMGSVATQENGIKDIPTESSDDNKVYKSKAGHLLEIDNTDGSERISVTHKSGTTINISAEGTVFVNASNTTVDITGNTTVHGNLVVNGTTHSTGDVSTDAGNAPTLATHTHTEVPGTGGASSPTPTEQETSVAN